MNEKMIYDIRNKFLEEKIKQLTKAVEIECQECPQIKKKLLSTEEKLSVSKVNAKKENEIKISLLKEIKDFEVS